MQRQVDAAREAANEGAGSPHHAGSGADAPRLVRWREPDCQRGRADVSHPREQSSPWSSVAASQKRKGEGGGPRVYAKRLVARLHTLPYLVGGKWTRGLAAPRPVGPA